MEAEAKRLWWELQCAQGSLSGGQRAGGRRADLKDMRWHGALP